MAGKGPLLPYRAPIFFWLPLCALAAFMYSQLLGRFSRLPSGLSATANDIDLYRRAGEGILRGETPYRDFFIEYPPGSLPAFVPPALFSEGREAYVNFFALEMALVLVAALVFTALAARSLGRLWPVPAIVFTAGTILLYPVAVTRYDPIVTLTLAAAAALVTFRARGASLVAAWAVLGFGAAAKLVPMLAALPLALLPGRTPEEAARSAVRGLVAFSLAAAAFFVPVLLLGGGGGLAKSFEYHADRGLQIESLGASVLMSLGRVEEVSFEFGAIHVEGRGVDLLSGSSLPVTAVLLALTALVAYREYRGGRFGPDQFPRFAAAFLLAFLLGSKVLSPQYVLWLLPLVPLSAGGAWGLGVSAVFLAVCWMTTQIFPYHYTELMQIKSPATDLLLGRNLLLAVLWALMLSLPPGEKKLSTAKPEAP